MGRFGNVMLINGEATFSGEAVVGEVVRLYLVNTANTRIFNFALSGARMKLVGGDSGRYEHETFVDEILLAPSERAVVDVLFDTPGSVRLEHRTPDRIYDLGAFSVSPAGTARASQSFNKLRTDSALTAERRIAPTRPSARQGAGVCVVDAASVRARCRSGVSYACPMHPSHRHEPSPAPLMSWPSRRVLRLPDAPRGHGYRAEDVPEVRDEAGAV